MKTWKILVIDDNAEESDHEASRYQKYIRLEQEKYEGRQFNLVFAKNGDNARALLRDNYDLVLLDVRLSKWGDDGQGTLFQQLFELADARFTVALVSSNWDTTSMQLVRGFLSAKPLVQLPLFFTFRDFENSAFAAIATQIVTHIRHQRRLYALNLQPNEPLRLLHLSDLHFGSDAVKDTLAGEPNIALLHDKIVGEWPERIGKGSAGPDLIIVTGDIGNKGDPRDYEDALDWLRKFAMLFGWSLPSPRILVVPGNHDFSIPLAAAQLISLNKQKSVVLSRTAKGREQLSTYAMQPFSDFAAKASTIWQSRGNAAVRSWIEVGFAEYGVIFSGINTSRTTSSKCWPLRHVEVDDIHEVNVAAKACAESLYADGLFHVMLSHHSLVKYSGVSEEIENADKCSEHLFNNRLAPKLLLHGHQHGRWGALPMGNDFMLIAGPTPTVRPEGRPTDSLRGLNLVTLERSEGRVTSVTGQSIVRIDNRWSILPLPGKNAFSIKWPKPKRKRATAKKAKP